MSKKPVHEIRFGLVKASIWENNTKNGTRFSISVCRLFKDGDTWRESSRYGRDDLPLLAKVADKAHTWIFEQRQDERSLRESVQGSMSSA
ncbi:MAG: hypothetical protein H6822_19235 [Planctomycetaceae bacterium]|nr:hypothetical protein [Planctomycetales bacterium]MCB9924320.1 hypothetical protein [Planctomycetaceae bacterium]